MVNILNDTKGKLLFYGVFFCLLSLLKVMLVPAVIPNSIPVSIGNGMVIFFTIMWLYLWKRRLPIFHLLNPVAILFYLGIEMYLFIPFLVPSNVVLSIFFLACLLQLFMLLGYTALQWDTRFCAMYLVLVFIYEFVMFKKIWHEGVIELVVIFFTTTLIFVIFIQYKTILRHQKETNDLYKKQKELNLKLTEAGTRLMEEEKQASMAMITAGLAHEINNPVNYLLGNLPFLRRYFATLKAVINKETSDAANGDQIDLVMKDTESIIDRYEEGLERITDIINTLKSLFQKKGMSHDATEKDLGVVLTSTIEVLGLQEKQDIVCDVCVESPLLFQCNQGDFFSIFTNLLRNSIDAIGEEGAITIRGSRSNGSILIIIEDNGPGISEEDRKQMFEPFFTTKEDRRNLGLGLTLCKRIIEGYGGTIGVESDVGLFTRVTIALPLEEAV